VRLFRLLAIIVVIALFYGATPLIGRWVTTANASSMSATSRPEAVNGPAADNDNLSSECDTGNPRKDKRCHYDSPNFDDNDNSVDTGGGVDTTQPPFGRILVSNADPNEGDTIGFNVIASGYQLTEISWWVSGYPSDDNDNDSGFLDGETHTAGCDGNNSCNQYNEITPHNRGTFTIHGKARDSQGRESDEFVTEVRVHG
jgi:hypothetical protein